MKREITIITLLLVLGIYFIYSTATYTPPEKTTTATPTTHHAIITYTTHSNNKTLQPGPYPYYVEKGTTYVLYYDTITSIAAEIGKNIQSFAPLAGDNPQKAAKNFKYCPEYNSPVEFAKKCGNCVDFFLLYAHSYPITAILIVNNTYGHLVYLKDSTVYDAWYTYDLNNYMKYVGYYYSPMVVYLITLYNSTKMNITTLTWGEMNDNGTYTVNDSLTIVKKDNFVFINGTLQKMTYLIECQTYTDVFAGNIILGCKNYRLYSYTKIKNITFYVNPALGTVKYEP